MERREFLKAFAGVLAWQLLPRSPAHALPKGEGGTRTLVLVELKGGNDGLNTVVPYSDARYRELRPHIAVEPENVLPLSEDLGFNPRLKPLMDAWNRQELAVLAGVGYPRPNRSHFRSIDIWETGSSSNEYLQTGWLTRLLSPLDFTEASVADGAVIGNGTGPFMGGTLRLVVLRSIEQFLQQAERARTVEVRKDNPALMHILSVQNDLNKSSMALKESLQSQTGPMKSFPETQIGREMQVAARLIASDLNIPAIKVSQSGYDTHSLQRGKHDSLLGWLAEALAAFRKVLQKSGHWERVLVMTYSEFGRRPEENGSRGTDHGTAAPHLLLGGNVKGGLYGNQPSLKDLQDGDMKHSVDYRSVYTTIARRWWGTKTDFLSGGPFPVIDCIG